MKLYEAKHLEQDTLKRIRSGIEEWDRFLKSAAHVYRYSFADQVMIYAQKPEATACASMNIWNTNMGCWIQRGQKGIALIDRNDTRKLKYVWDVSSVAVRAGGHKPKLWDIKEYHNDAVISQLSDTYGYGEASNSINDVLRVIVDNVSDEYSKELADDIYPVDESLAAKAENMDSRHETFRIAVREFFVHSIEIMVNERMGYDVLDETQHDLSFEKSLSELMFMQVADSMSEASCELLRQIGAVVLNYDKKQTDQSIDKVPKQEYTALKRKSIKVEGDEYGTRLHAEWGLSDTEHSTEPAVERTAGTNGETAQEVAGNKTSRKLHSVADAGHTGRYMSGGGTQSRGGDRPSYGEDDEGRERNGRTQAAGSDGVGQTSQQHQSQSRGDSSGYDSIHPVVEIVPESGTLPVFPSEEEQKEIIDNSLKEAETPASFFVAIESTNDFLDPKAGFTGYTGKKYRLVTTGDTGFLKAYPDESTMFSSERECQEYATEQGLTIINYDDMVFSSWKKKLEYEIAHEDTKEAVKNPSKRDKAHYNIQAIKMMKLIESENRLAFEDEKDVLRKYSGWGGIPEVFDENDPKWIEENKQLKRILSPEEYDMARSSTLNAHYTDPEIIEAMYTALKDMGFENGNILEPSMGIGNFFEAMPKSMAEDSRLYGVELDSITGRMAKLIYPEAHIEVRGYENTDFQNDFFDVAIGNVPFGQYKVLDKEYDSNNFLIHDYFFAKTIDKVRPGGIIAFITSKGTMDKQNSSVRRYISKRAELVGAVRLPNTAFKNAGTSVTSDIIFLKKRNALTDVTDPWVELAVDDNGIEYNSYFVDHPEMVLGSMQMVSGPHGPESTCVPESGTPLKEQIKKAISTFQAVYELDQIELPDDELFIPATIPAMPGIRNYSYSNVGNKIYYRENSVMIEKDISDRAAERITGLINIRESVGRLIDLQLEDAPDEEIIAARDRLNKTYDSFVKRCGYINTRTNKSLFRDDSSYSLLASLEDLDDNGNVIGKADMFTKRTIRKAQPVDHVDTSVDALAVSMGELGKVDLSYMSRLTGKTENDIVKDLEGIIFEEPVSHEWQTDIEQQEGRILRQGNINPRVKIFRYVTESTFDSYSWQIIENKQKFIGQIMTSKLPVRSCDDVDEAALSYAEVKALATGNPYIKEKMTLDTEVAKLKLLKANFKSQKYRLEDDIVSVYPQEISQLKDNISGYKADIAKRDTTRNIIAENFFITINGVSYHDRKSGGAALIEAAHNKDTNRVRIGSYMGFDLYSRYNFMYNGYELYIQGKKEHWVELSKDPVGVITRINNCLDGLDKKLEKAQSSLSDVYQKLESAKIEAAKEFDKEDELNQKLERLSELNALLDMDEKREEKEKQRKENEAIKQNKEISVHL